MAQIKFDKNLLLKSNINKIIDSDFKQLSSTQQSTQNEYTLDDFFKLYDDLFYTIPKEDVINSHRYLVNRSASYLGITLNEETNIQYLIDEITTLRNQLLESNKLLALK